MDSGRVEAYLQAACAALRFEVGEIWYSQAGDSSVAQHGGTPLSPSAGDGDSPPFGFGMSSASTGHSINDQGRGPACDAASSPMRFIQLYTSPSFRNQRSKLVTPSQDWEHSQRDVSKHKFSPVICEAVKDAGGVVWFNTVVQEGLLGRSDLPLRTALGAPVCNLGKDLCILVLFSPLVVQDTSSAMEFLHTLAQAASDATHAFLPASASMPVRPAQAHSPWWNDNQKRLQRLAAIRASLPVDVVFQAPALGQQPRPEYSLFDGATSPIEYGSTGGCGSVGSVVMDRRTYGEGVGGGMLSVGSFGGSQSNLSALGDLSPTSLFAGNSARWSPPAVPRLPPNAPPSVGQLSRVGSHASSLEWPLGTGSTGAEEGLDAYDYALWAAFMEPDSPPGSPCRSSTAASSEEEGRLAVEELPQLPPAAPSEHDQSFQALSALLNSNVSVASVEGSEDEGNQKNGMVGLGRNGSVSNGNVSQRTASPDAHGSADGIQTAWSVGLGGTSDCKETGGDWDSRTKQEQEQQDDDVQQEHRPRVNHYPTSKRIPGSPPSSLRQPSMPSVPPEPPPNGTSTETSTSVMAATPADLTPSIVSERPSSRIFNGDEIIRSQLNEFVSGFLSMSVFHAADVWLPMNDWNRGNDTEMCGMSRSETRLYLYSSNVQDVRLAKWKATSQDIVLASGVGLPGLVYQEGQPQWAVEYADVDAARNPLASVARMLGIRSAFGVPLPLGTEDCGVVMMYSTACLPPSKLMVQFVQRATGLLLGDSPAPVHLRQQYAQGLPSAEDIGRVAGAYQHHAVWHEQKRRCKGDSTTSERRPGRDDTSSTDGLRGGGGAALAVAVAAAAGGGQGGGFRSDGGAVAFVPPREWPTSESRAPRLLYNRVDLDGRPSSIDAGMQEGSTNCNTAVASEGSSCALQDEEDALPRARYTSPSISVEVFGSTCDIGGAAAMTSDRTAGPVSKALHTATAGAKALRMNHESSPKAAKATGAKGKTLQTAGRTSLQRSRSATSVGKAAVMKMTRSTSEVTRPMSGGGGRAGRTPKAESIIWSSGVQQGATESKKEVSLSSASSEVLTVCRTQGCKNSTNGRTPFCSEHWSAARQCQHPGCDKLSQGNTRLCIAHGGGRRCTFEGCNKGARDRLFCAAHGGGKRCSMAGCGKAAVGGSNLCTGHGGGKRCQYPACPKSAQSKTNFCVRHGGGRKCTVTGCAKVARGRTFHCAAHGGGVRCCVEGCNKAAVGREKMCRSHQRKSKTASAGGAAAPVPAPVASPAAEPELTHTSRYPSALSALSAASALLDTPYDGTSTEDQAFWPEGGGRALPQAASGGRARPSVSRSKSSPSAFITGEVADSVATGKGTSGSRKRSAAAMSIGGGEVIPGDAYAGRKTTFT